MEGYQPVLHPTAERELNSLDADDRDRLTTVLREVAETRQPTTHGKTKMLEGQPGLFRVRVGDHRAICELVKPELRVLRVGGRASVYNNVDELRKERAAVG